jgi:mono/diheme cytochrome c family protein
MKTALIRLVPLFTALVSIPAIATASSGEELWMSHCKKCHGEDGKGDTPMGKRFSVPDYTDPAVQEALTDDAIRSSIIDGKKNADGKKVMLAFGKRLSEEDVDALVAYFRTLQNE